MQLIIIRISADNLAPASYYYSQTTMPTTQAIELARQLTDNLPTGIPGLFNPWRERCEDDTEGNGPEARLQRLAYHLSCTPSYILLGEAIGYQGARVSGVAFTSERLILENAIPRLLKVDYRLTHRRLPFSEPSATIVWKNLRKFGIAEKTVLWNAVQMHPHRKGEPLSNRTPTLDELMLGRSAIELLNRTFPNARFIAVGKKSQAQLAAMGFLNCPAIRHPANGGANEFAQGLESYTFPPKP